jgi:hypothetical protein
MLDLQFEKQLRRGYLHDQKELQGQEHHLDFESEGRWQLHIVDYCQMPKVSWIVNSCSQDILEQKLWLGTGKRRKFQLGREEVSVPGEYCGWDWSDHNLDHRLHH